MFRGHQFVKLINDNWVLDLTEYIGYKVKVNENLEVESYRQAFQAMVIGEEIIFEKFTRVPIKILKEAASFIKDYESDEEELDD